MFTKKIHKWRGHSALALSLGMIGALTASGCGKSSTPAASTTVGLSGSLSAASGSSRVAASEERFRSIFDLAAPLSDDELSYVGDTIVCATLTTPPLTSSTSVNADGSFTISIPGGANQPMNCNLLDSSGNLLASIVASDSDHTDMNGAPQTQDALAFQASANLGTITYNSQTGEATVPVTNISGSLVTVNLPPSATFDPSGSWTIGPVSFTLPSGFVGPCASQHDDNCNGPPTGQTIQIVRFAGTSTTDSSNVYGMQIWQDTTSAAACGNKIGLTAAQAQGFGIDFSSNGSALAPFTFASSITDSQAGGTATITEGYKLSTAKTQYPVQTACSSKSITVSGTTYNGWVCHDNSSHYMASLGGGCVDSTTNKPVSISGNVTWGQCKTPVSLGGGYYSQSCSATSGSTSLTCTNTSGTFSDAALATPIDSSNFVWSDINSSAIASGASCGNGALSTLQQEQCYAQYYYMVAGHGAGGCTPRIDTDWSQTDATKFVTVDWTPNGLVLMDQLKYTSATSGQLRTQHDEIRGVQSHASSNGGMTPCHVHEIDELSFTKVDDTHIIATYMAETVTKDTNVPDCVASFGDTKTKFLFELTKQ